MPAQQNRGGIFNVLQNNQANESLSRADCAALIMLARLNFTYQYLQTSRPPAFRRFVRFWYYGAAYYGAAKADA